MVIAPGKIMLDTIGRKKEGLTDFEPAEHDWRRPLVEDGAGGRDVGLHVVFRIAAREMARHDAEEADLAGGEGRAARRREQAREIGTEAHLGNDDALVRRRRKHSRRTATASGAEALSTMWWGYR